MLQFVPHVNKNTLKLQLKVSTLTWLSLVDFRSNVLQYRAKTKLSEYLQTYRTVHARTEESAARCCSCCFGILTGCFFCSFGV